MAGRAIRLAGWIGVLGALASALAGPAAAERAAGINDRTNLVLFDTLGPVVSVSPITGLETNDETAIGLDTRPATGELFLFTTPSGVASGPAVIIRTYKLDPATAVATFVGALPGGTPAGAGDRPTGVDINPVVDRVRIVNAINESFRVVPATGTLAGSDPDLTFTAPATGPVTAVAYDRNVAPGPPGTPAPAGTRTTLYGIDVGADRLVIQGGVDGLGPGGPNGGQVTAVGPLGVTVVDSSDAGFDIAPGGGAYASLRTALGSGLYSVDLQTGAASLIRALPLELRTLTILAPDNCPFTPTDDQADLDGDGIGDACDADIDGDGVSNDAEQARGTDPRRVDSDGDGVADGADACATLASAGGNGCPPPALPPAPAIDDVEPTLTLSQVPRRVTRKRFLAGISARIGASEPVSLEVALLGRARSAGLARAGEVVLAERTFGLSATTRTVRRLKPDRRLVGRKARFSVRLRVIATDAAGNRSTLERSVRVG